MDDLRKAAELALEACEHLNRTGDTQVFDLCYADKVIPALRQALAQPEQEPVGYVTDSGKSAYILLGVDLEDDTPLYTAPPKREWVGLTDDELEDLEFASVDREYGHLDIRVLSQAIEQQLKEKNGG